MSGSPYTEVTPLDQLHQKLREQGFAIVKEHQLSEDFCEEAKNEVWQALEALITDPPEGRIQRDDASTYDNFFKLGPLHSMMLQHLGFSHLPTVWKAREAAAPVFAHLWNVEPEQLVSSMDAISFHIAPEKFLTPKGQFSMKRGLWWHSDQATTDSTGKCIQGFYNLCECGPNDGCLSVLSGSHKFHSELENAKTHHFYTVDRGCQWFFVCPPKGAFVIWDSRTIHMGTEPRIPRPEARDRLVFYICMLPKMTTRYQGFSCSGIDKDDLEERISAFQKQRTTTHWPYPVTMFRKNPRDLSRDIKVDQSRIPRMTMEDLSPLQRSLIGL